MIGRRMYRLLLLVLVLSLGGATGSSRAASEWSTVEIFSVDLAGRQTNLTHDPAWDVNPAVARDGRIAFFTNRIGGGLDAMDANGGAVRLVTAGGGIEVAEDLEWSQASWAPRGDRLAFDGLYLANPDPGCSHYCAGWHLLTVAADGSGLTEIARNARAPAWSPDGRRIAYENWTGPNDLGGPSGVTISSPDGSSAVKLTAFPLGDLRPVWSPRGGELAFGGVQRTAPRLGIYVVRADGTQMRRLTRGGDPSWSPDGQRFAFIRDGRLFTIGSNGKGRRRLSRKGEFVVGQAWAPKGHLIAYVEGKARNHGGCGVPGTIEVRDCVVPGSLRLKTVNANSGRVRVLMAERWTSFWGDPVWMPSAKRVLLTVQL
jgi:Tol biopolymer transport system component